MNRGKIASSGSLIHEKLERGHVPSELTDDAEAGTTDSKVAAVRRLFEREDADILDEKSIDDWPETEAFPRWVETFSDVLDYRSRFDDPNELSNRSGEPLPFEEIFAWIAEYSREHFVGDVDFGLVSDEARREFEQYLLERLVDVGGQPLHLDFISYIAERDPDLVRDDRRSPDETGWYDDYVADFFSERAPQFFEEYPVLARLLTAVARQWGNVLTQFVSRLRDDYRAICSLTGVDDLGQLSAVDIGAGDPHDGGQTVVVAEFEAGETVVYKPRDVEPEKRFYGFVRWLSRRFEAFPELQAPELIARDGYGWMEYVDSEPVSDASEAKAYYRRTGALLCVSYLLDMSDGHHENVIAGDGAPVIVDTETILQTETPASEIPRADYGIKLQNYLVDDSVLKTGLLPYEVDYYDHDMSGFAAIEEQQLDVPKLEWTHVNTDAMDIEYRPRSSVPERNCPTIDGSPARPSHFVDEIVHGFETAYDAIAQSKESVTEQVTESFSGVTVRNVVQSTKKYFLLLETISNPEYLKSGTKYEWKVQDELSKMWRGTYFASETELPNDVIDAEKRAILQQDVPRFTMETDADELRFRGERVEEGIWGTTGLEQAREKIRNLSEADKKRQLGLIRSCINARMIDQRGHQ